MMYKISLFISLLIGLLILSSCHKDEERYIVTNEINKGSITDIDINGYVFDDEGNPIEGAAVRIGNVTSETNEYGMYFFKNVKVFNRIETITISAAGYQKQIITEDFNDKAIHHQNYQLNPISYTASFDSEPKRIKLSQDVEIKFGRDAFTTAQHTTYSGEVYAVVNQIENTSENQANIPGDFRSYNQDGELGILISSSLMRIEFYDVNHNELKLNPSVDFQVSINSVGRDIQNSSQAWHFNQSNGTWDNEVELNHNDSAFTFDLEEDGWIAIGTFLESVEFSFKLVDSEGNPRRHFANNINYQNSNLGFHYTDASGIASLSVPKGRAFTLNIHNSCSSGILNQLYIDANNQDTYYGNIQLGTGDDDITLSGTLYDCNNTIISDGYIIYNNIIYEVDQNGIFEFNILACSTEIIVQAFDRNTSQMVSVDLNRNLSTQDLKITVCQ